MRNFRVFFLVLFTNLFLLQTLPAQESEAYVVFNQDPQQSYFDPYRHFERPGSNFEDILIRSIAEARTSIAVAVQELRLPRLAQALAKKKEEGLQVRVILENSYNQSVSEAMQAFKRGEMPESDFARYQDYILLADRNADGSIDETEALMADAVFILRASGIEIVDDTADGSKGSSLMHHKFMVIDEKSLIVTSANFTLSDIHGDLSEPRSRGNWNALVSIPSPQLAKRFLEEFNIMYGSHGDHLFPEAPPRFGVKKPYRKPGFVSVGNQERIAVQFSPTSKELGWEYSTNGVISRVILQARKSVHGALFVFSDQGIVDHLEKVRLEHDIDISFSIDPRFAYQYYSEALDMLGLQMLGPKCEYQFANRPWARPIKSVGRGQPLPGDLVHHKFAVVDDRFVLFGSHNWSESANSRNDENLLIIESPRLAREFNRELARIRSNTEWGVTDQILERIYKRELDCR